MSIESQNRGREKKDYIREALEYTGKELSQLQRASFIEKVSPNKWNYRFDTVKTYLEGIRNDYSYLNLSKNKNTTVMATQIALFKAWYMPVWLIDAKWWSQTMGYIKKFQKDNNLPISWYLTKRTVDRLIKVAAEKQGYKLDKKEEKKEEKREEKKETKPSRPQPSKKTPVIDKHEKQPELLSNTDTVKIKNAIKEIWDFDAIDRRFVIKDNKEISKGNKKYLKILWTEYEEYPSGLSSPDSSTAKNWYHNAWDYFIFGKFLNGVCYDWVKVSWDGGKIIEKWSFNTFLSDTIEQWERIYEDWRTEKWTFDSSAAGALVHGTKTSTNWVKTDL